MQNSNAKETAYDKFPQEYDKWFELFPVIFQIELKILKKHLPSTITNSLEIGVGTGRFAVELEIPYGIDPSNAMLNLAKSRGIQVRQGMAESLPYPNDNFDSVFFITSLCFIENYQLAIKEAKRVLKPNGKIIIGTINPDSLLGKSYIAQKEKDVFLKESFFHPIIMIIDVLEKEGFNKIKTSQTLFNPSPEKIKIDEPIKEGYDDGGFVVISAELNGPFV